MKKNLLLASLLLLPSLLTPAFAAAPAPAVSQTEIISQASRLRKLIPSNAVLTGSIDTTKLINSKLISLAMENAGMNLEQLLKEAGWTKEDCAGLGIFYLCMDKGAVSDAEPSFEFSGVLLFHKNESGKHLQDLKKIIQDEIKKDPEGNKDTVLKECEIQGKPALTVQEKENGLSLIASSPNCIQFRFFVNRKSNFELIPTRGELAPLAAKLDTNAMISLAVDKDAIMTLSGATGETQDPLVQAIRTASLSIYEQHEKVQFKLTLTSDLNSAQKMKTQLDAKLQEFQQNPAFANIVKSIQTSMNGIDLSVSGAIPLSLIEELTKQDQSSEDNGIEIDDDGDME